MVFSVQGCQRCIGLNGRISTSVRHSAAVKVTEMLTWKRRICAALLGGDLWRGKRQQRMEVPLVETAIPVFSSAAKPLVEKEPKLLIM